MRPRLRKNGIPKVLRDRRVNTGIASLQEDNITKISLIYIPNKQVQQLSKPG
jgi:hypothetical protein